MHLKKISAPGFVSKVLFITDLLLSMFAQEETNGGRKADPWPALSTHLAEGIPSGRKVPSSRSGQDVPRANSRARLRASVLKQTHLHLTNVFGASPQAVSSTQLSPRSRPDASLTLNQGHGMP